MTNPHHRLQSAWHRVITGLKTFRSWNHWYNAGLILWCVLLVVVTAKCVFKPKMHSVYPSYIQTVRANLRYAGVEHSVESAYISRQYGPVFTDLLAPFCPLDDRLGGTLWSLGSLGILLSAFYHLLTTYVENLNRKQLGIALLLLPWMGLASLYNGQLNIAITGLLLWGAIACQNRRWWTASILFAIPTAIKIYPVAMAMVFIALYPRQLLGRFAVTVLAVCCFPFLLHPASEVVAEYLQWMQYLASGEHYTLQLVRVDVRTFVETWIGPITTAGFLPVQMFSGMVIAFLVLCRQNVEGFWKEGENKALGLAAYSMTSLWLVLFGPATEEATYLLAAPAVALLLMTRLTSLGCTVTNLCLCTAAVVAGPLQTSILGETVRKWVLSWKLAPLALLALFIFMLGREIVEVSPRLYEVLSCKLRRRGCRAVSGG